MSGAPDPIAHFVGFAGLLRRAGFAVAPEQTVSWLAAIELLGPREIGDIRRAARATLAPPPERFAEFDALFNAHFLGMFGSQVESVPSEDEPIRAAEDSRSVPSRFSATKPTNPALRRRRRSGSRRAVSLRGKRGRRCGVLLAHFRAACRDGAVTAGGQPVADRARTPAACSATPCVTPARFLACVSASAGCGSGVSLFWSTFPDR